MPKNAADIAAKQVRRAQEASQDYIAGVQAVTESPGARAVKKKDKLRANFLASVDNGKWENNTSAVTREEWQEATVSKGGSRYASGVEAAKSKIEAFHNEFQPFVQQVKRELDSMPDATPEQREAKMLANVRKMRAFKRTRRRR